MVVRAASARGVVIDASGAPVVGAVVRAEGRQGEGTYYWLGPIENVSDGATATRDDGTFEIEGLVGGASYVFTATTPDGTRAHSSLLRVRDARPLDVEIRLVALRRLEVTVLDATTGAPVSGARVVASAEAEAEVVRDQADPVTTGPEGKARTLEIRMQGALCA